MLSSLIIGLLVVGVVLYLINAFVPMDPKVKKLLNIVVIIVLVIWCLQVFGILGPLDTVRIR